MCLGYMIMPIINGPCVVLGSIKTPHILAIFDDPPISQFLQTRDLSYDLITKPSPELRIGD